MALIPRFLQRKCKWNPIVYETNGLISWYNTIKRIRTWDIPVQEQDEILATLCGAITSIHKDIDPKYCYDIVRLSKKYGEIDVFEDGYGMMLCDLNDLKEGKKKNDEEVDETGLTEKQKEMIRDVCGCHLCTQ